MIVRKTRPEETLRANELFAIAFELPTTREAAAKPDGENLHRWSAFDDSSGEMMSTFTINDYTVRFDGHACRMGGIGGVATLPQYRRRGGIRGCFQAAMPDMYASGYDFSYLYPFSTAYYRKFGYECCVRKLFTSVRLSLLVPPEFSGTFRLAEAGNPMTEAIRSVDACWESKYNMMVQHRPEDYKWTEEPDPAVRQLFTYVCFAQDGTPKAYATFSKADEKEGRNLVCSRFCFADREGFSGLMNLFKSLSSDHVLAKFALPACEAMQYMLPEWSMDAASSILHPSGMVRVINAESVLKKAAYLGSGSAVLEIRDPQIPENSRTFAVQFSQGKAVSVEETQEEADAVLSITAFSALIAGVCGFQEAAAWVDSLEVRRPASLSQVFYRKPLMIADNF